MLAISEADCAGYLKQLLDEALVMNTNITNIFNNMLYFCNKKNFGSYSVTVTSRDYGFSLFNYFVMFNIKVCSLGKLRRNPITQSLMASNLNPRFICSMCRQRTIMALQCNADCKYSRAVDQGTINSYQLEKISEVYNVTVVDRGMLAIFEASCAGYLKQLLDQALVLNTNIKNIFNHIALFLQ